MTTTKPLRTEISEPCSPRQKKRSSLLRARREGAGVTVTACFSTCSLWVSPGRYAGRSRPLKKSPEPIRRAILSLKVADGQSFTFGCGRRPEQSENAGVGARSSCVGVEGSR